MFKSIWISIAYNFNKGVDVEKELGTTALVRVLQHAIRTGQVIYVYIAKGLETKHEF